MRPAAAVLNIIQERGKRKLPIEDLYRQLYNPDLYLRAYAKGTVNLVTSKKYIDELESQKILKAKKDVRSVWLCDQFDASHLIPGLKSVL